MNHVQITIDIVSRARQSLPAANASNYDVMDIEVLASDGRPAMIEFERVLIRREDGECEWRWEAITCWPTEPSSD
jgi:hypothetical protein